MSSGKDVAPMWWAGTLTSVDLSSVSAVAVQYNPVRACKQTTIVFHGGRSVTVDGTGEDLVAAHAAYLQRVNQ